MSQATSGLDTSRFVPGTVVLPDVSGHAALKRDNITISGSTPSTMLLGIGLVALVATIVGGAVVSKAHALASFHVGACTALAMSLGGLFFLQATSLTNAGWSATIRRLLENMASLAPICGVLACITPILDYLVFKGALFTWMNPEHAANPILSKKAIFFHPLFFFARMAIYLFIWWRLSSVYVSRSLEQDRTGDRSLSAKSRFTASWGMILTALSMAFCAFDWLMSFDFRFFSTMWGVYFFAGCAYSGIAALIIITQCLRNRGLLKGVITEEHYHDLGKLQFAFTIFWAYIAFSQYFLIWYSNIPEETAWYVARKQGGWEYLFYTLCFGHFLVPFLVLVFRDVKRKGAALTFMAGWAITMQVLDMIFIVCPMAAIHEAEANMPLTNGAFWIDAAGAIGCIAIFFGLLWRVCASRPLVAVHDPRMAEALHHKNYV